MMKKDFIIALSANKNILRQFVSVMTSDETDKRIRDYWTIHEHIDHLVITQKMLLGRIQQFIDEDRPVMKPYIPDDVPGVEISKKCAMDLVNEFCDLRDRQIALIKNAGPGVWLKEGSHEEYKKYNFEILARHIILHDSFHMWRMEELWIEREDLIQKL